MPEFRTILSNSEEYHIITDSGDSWERDGDRIIVEHGNRKSSLPADRTVIAWPPDELGGDYSEQTVSELRDELEERDLKKSGTKDELIARLEEDDG